MENLDVQAQKGVPTCCICADLHNARTVNGSAGDLNPTPVLLRSGSKWNDAGAEWRAGEIYKDLSPSAMSELESLAVPFCCESTKVLFMEEEEPRSLLFLLEGRVKLTMSSNGGKRLMLGIAVPGDVLGLGAVVSGCPYEVTAVAQFPCRIRAIPRKSFLELLSHHPNAWQTSAHLLSVESKRRIEQLRILGLALTSSMKLARLLLHWCAEGQRAERGVRLHCSLTHGEIGEYVGLSRETVTRNLINFKNLNLVQQHGAVFFIPSLRALQIYVE
jgi:CRP/FNR family transcriptional regulator, cyclic AMP receptor protein